VKRRDFLGAGLAGLAAGTSSVAAAEPPSLDDRQMKRRLRRIRRELDRIDRLDLPALAPARKMLGTDEGRAATQLIRSAMRTLLITSSVGTLSAEDKQDPRVRSLVREHSAEMDYATVGMISRLQSMSDEDRRFVQSAIRDDPGSVLAAGEMIDEVAGEAGIHEDARRHLRDMVRHSSFRMTRQPLALVHEEVTAKTVAWLKTVQEALGPDTGLEATPEEAATWGALAVEANGQGGLIEQLPDRDDKSAEAWRKRAGFRLAAGGALLLIGAGTVGAAILLSEVSADLAIVALAVGLVTLTAAVVMLIVGLVTLIIAAVRTGEDAREP
jgi:hypothetical protein